MVRNQGNKKDLAVFDEAHNDAFVCTTQASDHTEGLEDSWPNDSPAEKHKNWWNQIDSGYDQGKHPGVNHPELPLSERMPPGSLKVGFTDGWQSPLRHLPGSESPLLKVDHARVEDPAPLPAVWERQNIDFLTSALRSGKELSLIHI